jgi:hypothetical protein
MRPLPSHVSLPLLLVLLGLPCGCASEWQIEIPPEEDEALLLGLGIAPDRSVVSVGEGLQFVATGFYSDQSTRDLTDVVRWQSWREDILSVSTAMDREGFGSAIAAGNSRVRARYMGLISNELSVWVTGASLEQLTIRPAHAELVSGQELQLVAEAAFSDGSRGNVSGSVRWITSDASVVTVGPAGRIATAQPGAAQVRAVYESQAESIEAAPALVQVVRAGESLPPADLRVVGAEMVAAGDVVFVSVEIENVGGMAATDLWVDFWLERSAGPPSAPTAGDAYEIVPYLAAGAQATVALELSDVDPGDYAPWLLVDSLDTNDEGAHGESDNTWGPGQVHVAGGPSADLPPADLVISYFEAWAFSEPDEVLYFIDVSNLGGEATGTFGVGVFSDLPAAPVAPGSPEVLIEVASLAPGDTDYLSAVIEGVPNPSWSSFALADVNGSIAELLEDNNTAQFQVTP